MKRVKREPPVKQATPIFRDSRGFVPSYAGGRVRRIRATE